MADMTTPDSYADFAPDGPRRSEYLTKVIRDASRSLRLGGPPALIASDLEDALSWSTDPDHCGHPLWTHRNGVDRCRYCDADVSHLDPMGG